MPIYSRVTERAPGSIRRLTRAAKGNQSEYAFRQTPASIGGGLLILLLPDWNLARYMQAWDGPF